MTLSEPQAHCSQIQDGGISVAAILNFKGNVWVLCIFLEIPNFLSDEECDHIVRLAESKQFISSVARGGLQSMSDFEIPDIRSKNRCLWHVVESEVAKMALKGLSHGIELFWASTN